MSIEYFLFLLAMVCAPPALVALFWRINRRMTETLKRPQSGGSSLVVSQARLGEISPLLTILRAK